MIDERGNLSIDFLVGFTVFLIAFIWVASMISGIMVGLQSSHIDYDAVAYRTGVILAEDPGWPVSPPWESYEDGKKFEISRFGLALSKDTPGILSQEKVSRFFCSSFIYPDDYHSRAIFGDYPYRFNISVSGGNGVKNQSVGDVLPDGYGYIRRLVKIKGASNATIDITKIAKYKYNNTENVTQHEFSILLDNLRLQEDMRNPAYQINPLREQIMINITDLNSTIREFDPDVTYPAGISRAKISKSLTSIKVYKLSGGTLSMVQPFDTPYIDGVSVTTAPPWLVEDNVSMIVDPSFFSGMQADYSKVYFNLTFNMKDKNTGNPVACTFLNNTNARAPPFDYYYYPKNVTQPQLRDAVVEVAVW